MAEHIPNFVSLKERYICTPEVFLLYIERMGIRLIERSYLNLARVDRVESFEDKEGVLFLATPHGLSSTMRRTIPSPRYSVRAAGVPLRSPCWRTGAEDAEPSSADSTPLFVLIWMRTN